MKTKRKLTLLIIMLLFTMIFLPKRVEANELVSGVPIGYQKYGDQAEKIFYDDLNLLALITWAESGNQSLEGKRLVVDVVLNRMDDPRFPDTIREVISQPGQFATYRRSTLNKAIRNVTDECYTAVSMEVMNRTDKDILSFRSGHFSSYGTRAYKNGDHYFNYLHGAGDSRHSSIEEFEEGKEEIIDPDKPLSLVKEISFNGFTFHIYNTVSDPYILKPELDEYYGVSLSNNDIPTESYWYYEDNIIEKGAIEERHYGAFVSKSSLRNYDYELYLQLLRLRNTKELDYIITEPSSNSVTFNLIRWSEDYGWVGYYYAEDRIISYKLDENLRVIKEIN